MTENISKKSVFLSYAREDHEVARNLCLSLRTAGIDVWMDVDNLPPGARWKQEIIRAIRRANYFIALLSPNSVSKRGFVQTEIREGLEVLNQHPEDEIYILPVRLGPCQPTHKVLEELNWVDLFPSWDSGISKLVRFLSPSLLRFDGAYVNRNDGVSLIRFYEDGAVYVNYFRDPGNVVFPDRTHESRTAPSKGRYETDGNRISFTTENVSGNVDYKGEISGNQLIVRFHSHINNNRGIREFSLELDTH